MNRITLSQSFYLSAVFITFVGNSLIFIAAGKTAFDCFGFASVFGALLMMEFFQSLLLSGFAGWAVERFSARGVAIVADSTLFFVETGIALLALAGQEKWAVILIMLFVNVVKPFQNAAAFSFIRQICPKAMLFRLNSRSAIALNGGYLIGLCLAGLLLSRVLLSTFLLIDAATYLVSALLFTACSVLPSATPEVSSSRRLSSGLLYTYLDLAKTYPSVVQFALLIGIQLNITIAYNTLLFKNVAERYADHPGYLSILEAIFTISYLVVSALLSSHDRFRLSASKLWSPFVVQGMCFVVFAVPLRIEFFGAVVLLFGALSPVIFSSAVTSLHDHTPDEIQSYIGGLKGSVQALVALPLLALNSVFADRLGLGRAFVYLACINLGACWLSLRDFSPRKEAVLR